MALYKKLLCIYLVESRTTTIGTIWISHVATIRRKRIVRSSSSLVRMVRFLITQWFGHGNFEHLPCFPDKQTLTADMFFTDVTVLGLS
jgi:hypothetical protein